MATSFRFETTLVRGSAGDAAVRSGSRPELAGGPPPEFGGSADTWSPEHLLVASAALCYLTTLDWFARRAGVPILDFRCSAGGTVEKTARGLAFTSVSLSVQATAALGQGPRMRELMDTAKESCLVAHSLTCPVEVTAEVTEAASADAA